MRIDRKVLPLGETEPLQFVEEHCILRRRSWGYVQGTEVIGPARLLRVAHCWGEQCYPSSDELAPLQLTELHPLPNSQGDSIPDWPRTKSGARCTARFRSHRLGPYVSFLQQLRT